MTLPGLRRSLLLCALALSAMVTSIGCGTLARPRSAVSPRFASGELPVRSIALLPIDVGLQIAGDPGSSRQLLGHAQLDRAVGALVAALQQKGYRVAATIGDDGVGVDSKGRMLGVVLHANDLQELRIQLHGATAQFTGSAEDARRRGDRGDPPRQLIEARVDPRLTRALGLKTDSDASLYLRGWAYVDPDEKSTGQIVGQVLLGILLAAVVVGALALLLIGRGSRSGHVRSAAKGGARMVAGFGRVLARTVMLAGSLSIHARRPRAAYALEPIPCRSCETSGPQPVDPSSRRVQLFSGTPKRSLAGVALTLVHNRSGQVLWHVGQSYFIKLSGSVDLDTLLRHLLADLPRAPAS